MNTDTETKVVTKRKKVMPLWKMYQEKCKECDELKQLILLLERRLS